MILSIFSNIWSFAKALEFLWLIRAPISWYWKEGKLAYNYSPSNLLKDLNVLWSRAGFFFCNTITFYQTAHIIARNLARWRTNSNNFAILIVLHRKHRYPQLGCHFIFLMKIRRYVLQTETEQDIGHVFIDKETRERYHQLFIIYCTNKKKSEVQRRVFEKKETRYKFIYIYIYTRPSLSNISILPFQDRNTKAIDCLALSLSLNSKKIIFKHCICNKNKKNFISKISEIYKNIVILVNFFKD